MHSIFGVENNLVGQAVRPVISVAALAKRIGSPALGGGTLKLLLGGIVLGAIGFGIGAFWAASGSDTAASAAQPNPPAERAAAPPVAEPAIVAAPEAPIEPAVTSSVSDMETEPSAPAR